MESKDIYNNLVECLRLVALSPEKQIQILPDFIVVPDEIALIYNDIYIMVHQIEGRLISSEIFEQLSQLDLLFDDMSGNASLWTIECFIHGRCWIEIRQLARLILERLKEACDIPNLDFLNWIKND